MPSINLILRKQNMLSNSNPFLLHVREHLADRFTRMRHPRPLVRRRQATSNVLPLHVRFGIGLFSVGALLASVTAGATALYVFWIVYQDFSA